MENPSSSQGTEMGPPAEAEIAERLERATRAVLASSSLASYSFSESSAREELPQLPSLTDLLAHVGPPDCPRCPSCRAPLPFGSLSHLCLACDATLVEIPLPSLTSSIAFRRFSEALDLETDFGVAEEEHFPDQDVYFTNKFSSTSSLSPPVEAAVQKGLLHAGASSDRPVEAKVVETNFHIPLSHTSKSADFSSVTSAETVALTQRHSSILDYAAKLEGISLEDFFSNQAKQEASTPPKPDIISIDVSGAASSMNNSGVKVQKDSLFWDPLSETIIPDGFDMMTDPSKVTNNEGVEEDDPFDSWESDFQSAPQAISDASEPHASVSKSAPQPGDLEDFFGNLTIARNEGSGESLGLKGSNGWVNDAAFWGSGMDTSTGRNVDIDDLLFGSEWQRRVPPSAPLATNGSQSTNLIEEDDLFGPLPPLQKMPTVNDSSFDFTKEGNSIEAEDEPLTEPMTSISAGTKNKIVESLRAQLHDLSFMLTDKLAIRAEVKDKDPKPSSSS